MAASSCVESSIPRLPRTLIHPSHGVQAPMSIPSKALALVPESTKRARVAYVAKEAASTAGWQVAKSPLYLWRVFVHSCRGALYTFPPIIAWVWAGDKLAAAKLQLHAGHATSYDKLQQKWMYAVGLRAVLVVGPPLFVLATLHNKIGNAAYIILGSILALVLAFIGSRMNGETITDPTPPKRRDLTQERLDAVFRTLGLLRKPKDETDADGTCLEVRLDPHRADGGVELAATLPAGSGKTATHVIAKREEIAAELGVELSQLLIEKAPGGAGSFRMWLAEKDPFDRQAIPSPYLSDKKTSVFEGFRVGPNARGNPVYIPMMNGSLLIGGLTGQGKSTVGRLAACAVALDPYCSAVLVDPKASADWKSFVKLTDQSVRGAGPTEVAQAIEVMRGLVTTMTQRYKDLEHLAPDGNLTPEIADEHNMYPIVCFFDELQSMLLAADSKQRRELSQLLTQITNMGRQAGIFVVTMTQRPSSTTVPTDFRGSVGNKIAVRCADSDSSDIVLGEGSAKAGSDASKLPAVDPDSGKPARAIVHTGRGADETVMVDWVSLEAFEALCDRGYRMRAAAQTLRTEDQQKPHNILDDVRAILEQEDGLTSAELARRLGREGDPKVIGRQLGLELKPFRVQSKAEARGSVYYLEAVNRAFG